jgi:hypothetical protein
VRYAVAVACVVLILVLVLASGFDPLLVPAVIGGLLLGLLVRTLWSNRSRLPRSIRHRAILVALLAAALVAAFITSNIANLQRSAPTIRVPQIVTPRYDGTVTWTGDKWQQTDRITLSPKLLEQIEKAKSEVLDRDRVTYELDYLLIQREWSVQKKGNGLLLIPRRRHYTPAYLDGMAERLNMYLGDTGWSVKRTSKRLFAAPKRRTGSSRARLAAVTDELVQNLEYQGWKAEKVGDDLVFTQTQVTDDTVAPDFLLRALIGLRSIYHTWTCQPAKMFGLHQVMALDSFFPHRITSLLQLHQQSLVKRELGKR